MLITKTEELQGYGNLPTKFDIKKITSFIEAAEIKYIKPFIGPEQYTELTTAYEQSVKENPVALNQATLNLLHYVRRPLVELALSIGGSSLAVSVSSNGITRIEEGAKKSAYQYQELAWKQDKLQLGLTFLDDLGDFLDENLDEYGLYAESEAYLANRGYLVSTAKMITELVGLPINRYIFMLLTPQINRLEKRVKRDIGTDEFNELKQAVLGNIPTEKEDAVFLAREGIAHLALASAAPLLRLKIDAQGITMIHNEKTKAIEVNKPVKDSQANDLISNLTAIGEAALIELKAIFNPIQEEETTATEATPFVQPKGNFIT